MSWNDVVRSHADHLAPTYTLDTPGGFCSAFPFAALAKVPSIKHICSEDSKIFHIINLEDKQQAPAALVDLDQGSQPHETSFPVLW